MTRPGSSPLTRGKLRCQVTTHGPVGLIPAHAGKTCKPGGCHFRQWAHPRSRGENRIRRDRETPDRGLIPAHAGKTPEAVRYLDSRRAHPRSRGENGGSSRDWSAAQGSSPLTRGKRRCRVRVGLGPGLIPAHAGKTTNRRSAPTRHWAHPRSRGENRQQGLEARRKQGSSPLTRGKPRPLGLPARTGGLIPAHAGKTRRRPRARP